MNDRRDFTVRIETGEMRDLGDPRGIDVVGCRTMLPPEGMTVADAVQLLREHGYVLGD